MQANTMRPPSRRRRACRSRHVVLAALLTAVVLHLGLVLAAERDPGIRDPLYGKRIGHILDTQTRHGDRKPVMVMMLGTSRTYNGFNAGWMEDNLRLELGAAAAVCNYGIPGGGPVTQQVHLRRLLKQGARPDLLLIEVLPRFYCDFAGKPLEFNVLDVSRIQPDECDLLEKYGIPRDGVDEDWERLQRNPWGHLRFQLLSRVRSKWVPITVIWRLCAPTDRWGWLPLASDYAHAPEYLQRRELAHREVGDALREFRFSEPSVAALADLLQECRRENIPTALVHMPEGSDYRCLYNPGAKELIARTFAHLAAEHGASFLDASDWVPDGNFFDSHHLVRSGAELFTARLQREFVLPRLRQGFAMSGK